MPGTPSSLTCSVHSDPDQYRCWCRTKGSVNQPGAVPVEDADVAVAAVRSVGAAVGGVRGGAVNERCWPGDRPDALRRRCEASARITNIPPKIASAIHDSCP